MSIFLQLNDEFYFLRSTGHSSLFILDTQPNSPQLGGGGLIQDTQPSFPELWGLGFNPGYTTIPSGALILDTQPSFPELEGGRVILIHNKPLQS